MKRDHRQLKKTKNKQRRFQYFMMLCVMIFSLPLFVVIDGKAADSSAGYPSKPIEVIIRSQGGPDDRFCRTVSDIVQKEKILNQPLVVNYKPGSGGAVSMGYVFEKKGNPYIVLYVASSSFIGTTLLEKLPYNIKSFTPIANFAVDGSVLMVRNDSPFRTIEDIIAEAKKRPKELIQGGSAFTSPTSMIGRSIQKAKGVQWNFISFKNETEALLNVLSGTVHFALAAPNVVLDHVSAGKARVLLANAPVRYTEFKDAPTIKEVGMGDPILIYRGMAGPPNMPDYAVKKLEAAFKKVMDSDRFKKFIKDSMMYPSWLSSGEYGKILNEENEKWKDLLTALDLLKKK
jgi:putative tricarboxylic transport membrane protein